MNPRVEKLKQEREKNEKKIATLQARNKKIDSTILELENTDIIGMVREIGMSPDALAELLRSITATSRLLSMTTIWKLPPPANFLWGRLLNG